VVEGRWTTSTTGVARRAGFDVRGRGSQARLSFDDPSNDQETAKGDLVS